MIKLIKTEWIKISRNRIFWITLAAYVVTIILILTGMRAAINSINQNMSEATSGMTILPAEIYRFPHVWHNLTFITKYIKFFIGILMILLVSNEFYYNTLRQNIITGMSRRDFIAAKFIDGLMLAFFATLLIFVFGLVAGIITTKDISFHSIFAQIEFIPGYFLMLSVYLSFILMLSVILRKAVLTMGILFTYELIIENFLLWKLPDSIDRFLPVNAINGLIIAPRTKLFAMFHVKTASNGIDPVNIAISVGYMILFLWISYKILNKRDL